MLKDKVIVVTGGAGKIGSAFIESIVLNGGIGVIADIDIGVSNNVKSKIIKSNPSIKQENIEIINIDITKLDSISKAISELSNKYGKIDALVNNAYPRTKNWGREDFFDLKYEDFCENMNMQLGGYLLSSQQFAKYFKVQKYGNIVSISSIQGVYAPKFDTYTGTNMRSPIEYSVIKAGICHMTRYLAKYLSKTNIRVNAIAPGGILDNQPESFLKKYAEYCTTKGMLDAVDISGTLVFLLSDESKYINGQVIVVDDGWGL